MIFEFDGQYDMHTFTMSPEFMLGSAVVAIDASFLHVDTQAGLTHWEPLFLVLGVQNFEVDDLTLEWIRMARLGVNISVPILAMHLGFHFEQYVPLALHYAPGQTGGGPATGQPSVTRKTSTDGGRRFGITLSL
jgi:hypothetical protein